MVLSYGEAHLGQCDSHFLQPHTYPGVQQRSLHKRFRRRCMRYCSWLRLCKEPIGHSHAEDPPNLGFISAAALRYLSECCRLTNGKAEGDAKPMNCL